MLKQQQQKTWNRLNAGVPFEPLKNDVGSCNLKQVFFDFFCLFFNE